MSYQDFLPTPLSFPAERSPKEPWPENSTMPFTGHIPSHPRSAENQKRRRQAP
jgi:hypothetical protein